MNTTDFYHALLCIVFTVGCFDGDVRLVGGGNVTEGRVEVCSGNGEQCVMTFGALLMPEWFVDNWAIQPMVYLYNKIIVHGCFEL